MNTSTVLTIAIAALGATGCAGATITPNTPVQESRRTAAATLLIGEITHPRDLTTSAPFYVTMQREAVAQLDRSHVADKVVAERDLGPTGVTGKAYALRYRIVEDHVVVTSTGTGCRMALTGTGSLTLIPLFFLGLCTATAEHRLQVEARVFDLDSVSVAKVRDENSNEMLNVYDTSTLTPVLRREYPVKVVLTTGIFSIPTGDAAIALEKQEAAEAVRQILAQSLGDVSAAVDRSARLAAR